MPIYSYHCQLCKHEFTELIRNEQEIKDLVCPECGSKNVEKQFSTFEQIWKCGGRGGK